MPVLHQLMSADASLLRDCGLLLREGDTLLLVDGATEWLAWPGSLVFAMRVRVAAARADVLARGLEASAGRQGIELIDDDVWVRWVCTHDRVVSWT